MPEFAKLSDSLDMELVVVSCVLRDLAWSMTKELFTNKGRFKVDSVNLSARFVNASSEKNANLEEGSRRHPTDQGGCYSFDSDAVNYGLERGYDGKGTGVEEFKKLVEDAQRAKSLYGVMSTIDKLLDEANNLHALLKTESNGALSRSSRLGESTRATERTSSSAVADTNDADVISASDGSFAGYALGHLDLKGEVGVYGEGETVDADSRNILGHSDFAVIRGYSYLGLLTTASRATTKESTQEVTQLASPIIVIIVALVITLRQVRKIILNTSSAFSAVIGRNIISVSATQEDRDYNRGINRAITLGPA
ncbi:hypothetical protein FOXYS1_10163 [Fusarium oxysporum]|uniref:Uncharacterized protein n=1 Tax=Fusarium oxysporum TaxID=5507 RepID=A0A8H5A6Y7_FUSOX|nr:hypothetical protein FOXYS1_10163 [Fusarium oxysporum]